MSSVLEEAEKRQRDVDRATERIEKATAALNRVLAMQAKHLVPDVDSVTLSDVVNRPVRWLWPGRIPRGKITLIAGNPGLGKSQITCSIASIVTGGGLWPVDRGECEPGSVMILSAEDDAEDTIAPRFEAADARLERCEFIRAIIDHDHNGQPVPRCFDMTSDIEKMMTLAKKMGDVRLIIIDPISAYLGATDAHKNAQIRGILGPVAGMARELDASVLLVTHLNKGGSTEALMRVMDSVAFVAAARAAYLVIKDDTDESGLRRLFLPMKNNLGPDTGGLSYQIIPVDLGEGISTSRVEWGSDLVTTTADEAMTPAADRTILGEAREMLKQAFAEGPILAEEMKHMAKMMDTSTETLRRAAKALGATCKKQVGTGKWVWCLPGSP